MSIRLKLSAEKREAEARALLDDKSEFERRTGFQSYVDNLRKWDIQWRGTIPRLNGPWPHASDYNPLITFSKVEDVHALLYGFFANFDFFTVAASGKAGLTEDVLKERAQNWTDLLRWSMQNESNSSAFIDRFIHDGILFGTGFGYMPWMRLSRKIRAEVFIPEELRAQHDISDRTLIKAALGEDLIKGPTPNEDESWNLVFRDDDGVEKVGRAWIDRANPFHEEGEPVLIIERDSVYYNAPRPKSIAPWDILVPPDVCDLQTARRFWVREFMTFAEISQFAANGLFNALSRQDLSLLRVQAAQRVPNVSTSASGPHDGVDTQRDTETGVSKLEARADSFEIFFEYALEDVDGDGSAESIVRAVVMAKKPILLMRHPIEYLYPHGRRPFFDWHYLPVSHRYYGMGVPELLERTQIEANAFYQARNDVIEIITKPGGLYNPMSGLAPEEIKFTPGMMIKVTDPATAYRPLVFPTDPTHLIREQSGAELQAERAIGSTDLGLGRGPTRPNAPRTLGGTAIVVRQQQLRSDVYLRRVMYGSSEVSGGVQEFLQQYMSLYAAYMPAEKEFRALGTDELRVVQRSDLQGRFDFVIDFGPEINNPQIRMQNAVLRYQNSVTNPLILRTPEALWQLTVDLWEATGRRHAARLIPRPPGAQEHPPMPQEEEILVLSKGIYIEVLPTDDHGQHLQVIAQLLQDPIKLAQNFGPSELPLLERHAQKHLEALQSGASAQLAAGAPGGLLPAQTGPASPGLMQPSPGGGMPTAPPPAAPMAGAPGMMSAEGV